MRRDKKKTNNVGLGACIPLPERLKGAFYSPLIDSVQLKILICVFLFLIASLSVAEPEQMTVKYKIALAVWSGYPESVAGFKKGLAAKGLIEGQNVSFLVGKTGADKALQREVAEGFKHAQVDLVYSLTTPGTSIIKEVLPETTPIVYSIVTYPADSGLIESFEYSGNNLVGTSNYVPIRHYLKLLKLIVPTVKTVAIFHRKGEPNSKIQAVNMIRFLKREGINSIDLQPENLEQVKQFAFEYADQVDAFMTTTDTLMQSGGEKVLIEVSLNKGIPILSSNKAGIEHGSTFGPVADFYTLAKKSAGKAAQILLGGLEPSKIQSELQDPPLFLVNRASIKKLGIELSKKTNDLVTWVD